MHAVFAYAEWVQSANPPAAGDPVRPLPGEVKSLLEERLSSDPSAAVRSVIGHAFPYLWHVEPTWAEEQRERIFSTDAPGVAAWEAFVLFREPPRPSLFRALRPLYLQAVRRAVEARDEARRMQDPHEHLAWHLMPPCWGGELAFGQPDGLLDEFFSRAPVALRAHALESVGRALTNTEGAVPEPELQRILNLWTRRRTTLLATDTPTDSLDELVSFGWWFASEKLDEDWALSELIAVIGATRKVEPDHFVLEHLAKTVVRRPMPSLRALRLLVEGASDPWFVDAHAESIESIIRAALRGSGESRAAAAEFVNRLAARGSLRFRGLLAEPDLGAEEGED